jgi:hypothetical protein
MAPGDHFFNPLAAMAAFRQGFLIDLLKHLKSIKAVLTGFAGVYGLIFVDRHKQLMLKAEGSKFKAIHGLIISADYADYRRLIY